MRMKILIDGTEETPEVPLNNNSILIKGYFFPEDPIPFF